LRICQQLSVGELGKYFALFGMGRIRPPSQGGDGEEEGFFDGLEGGVFRMTDWRNFALGGSRRKENREEAGRGKEPRIFK